MYMPRPPARIRIVALNVWVFSLLIAVACALALPESMFHVALDHDSKGPSVSLSSRGIGSCRAVFRGVPHRLSYVVNRDIRQVQVLVRGKRLADAHQRLICLRRNTGLPEIGVWSAI